MKTFRLLMAVLSPSLCLAATVVAGVIAPAPGQPAGALSGRIVFTSGGHGWTSSGSSWGLQRPVLLEMCEDFGNVDQMTLFAYYCFNAGATVVPFRPIGNQTNEVVLDNDDAGVSFLGPWSNSTFTNYYGSPGDIPYRFAAIASVESATAFYTPNLPATGFYPVYTWAGGGTNRTSQLYRIRHTGGEAAVRIPHYLVGNGWIYLGTYHFNAGSNPTNGAVVISNLEPSPSVGSVVIADAVRFGNGMGTIDRGGGISTYPREEECSRYWVQNGVGQGQPPTLYDDPVLSDANDNVGTPPRTANEMNREESGNMFQRIYIGFHSNATTGNPTNATSRGVVGLYNNPVLFPGTATSNQFRLAQLCGREINDDLTNLTAFLEVPWFNRGNAVTFARTDFAFGEINNNAVRDEFDATIIEVAFHDNTNDVKLLRDPGARTWMARAACQAVVRYMNEFDGAPLQFLPEPPYNVRALATTNGIAVSWSSPVAQAGSGEPTLYRIYLSTDGYGFGNPMSLAAGGANAVTWTNLAPNTDYYFRVAAANAGGESFPSEVVGCRRSTNPAQSRILFVNAFNRFERTTNLRQTPVVRGYQPPGNAGTMERVMPRANNAFDYVVAHGRAIQAFGMPFDSCGRLAVAASQVLLANYQIVIWEAGQNLTGNFLPAERNAITNFQNSGGHLLVSGADIAWDLDRATGPTPADRAFLNHALHADLGADANHNSQSYTAVPAVGTIFNGSGNATFDNGTRGIYWVQQPDALTPAGAGASAALQYSGGLGGAAAVQYDGSAGGGRLVYLGFPFETITNSSIRSAYMADVLRFFSKPARLVAVGLAPGWRPVLTLSGEPGVTYGVQVSSNLTQWTTFTNVLNVNGLVTVADGPIANVAPRFYRAVLSP